ncbi:MAG: response regulator [Prolixibacteraceae bacterium]|jgi:CheY-like chemotaxis protein|nr:response regulator [Prolixibacteraceae bacterium]
MMEQIPSWVGKTVLVVEDEEVARYFYKTALQNTGVKVLFAVNGAEGVRIASETEKIDCILMDLRLPVMDGYEATRNIKAMYPNIPLIVQTAYVLSNERLKAFQSGCDEFISKPVSLRTLFTVLHKYLD